MVNPAAAATLWLPPSASSWSTTADGFVVAPKGGYADIYSLALSSRYISKVKYVKSNIKIPQVSLTELQDEYKTIEQENWAPEVFGNMAYKIRPDVLRYIRMNKDTVIKRLSKI